jgi:hypothetical protein
MNTKAQVFILCEDTFHYHFARKYFELLGFNNRNIRGTFNPKGRSVGSGAKYVQDNYDKEVKAFHSKVNHLDSILVIVIDDDTKNINDEPKNRVRILHEKYKPLANESILIISPIRNIESWFCYIDTNNTNVEIPDENGEIQDYKKNYQNAKPTEFAKKLKEQICINGLPENILSSLRHACNELKRLSL